MVAEVLEFMFGAQDSADKTTAPAAGVVLDATAGTGGHSLKILERFAALPTAERKTAYLIGIDQDPEALAIAREELSRFTGQFQLIQGNFRNLAALVAALDLPPVNGYGEGPGHREITGIFMDLGLSSLQVESGERGFSFLKEGPLDMRMSPRSPRSARQIVLKTPEHELANLFYRYGEERFSRRIARRIVEARERGARFETTTELADLIASAVPRKFQQPGKHPATRCFQALRIAVNEELEALPEGLDQARGLLAPSGRLAVISYHSLEDRIVKQTLTAWQREGAGRVLKPFPAMPGEAEVAANRRARSAKLRGFAMAAAGRKPAS